MCLNSMAPVVRFEDRIFLYHATYANLESMWECVSPASGTKNKWMDGPEPQRKRDSWCRGGGLEDNASSGQAGLKRHRARLVTS